MAAYRDREDAARELLNALPSLDGAKVVVIALPRGGVPIGAVIAKALGAPLELMLVRKVGAPGNPELAIGAVTGSDEASLVVNESVAQVFGLSPRAVRKMAAKEIKELERRRTAYLGDRPQVPVTGRTVILVDDGIATGTTVRAALSAIRAHGPERIILAVPVASAEALEYFAPAVEEIVCPYRHLPFGAVGAAYDLFPQVSDAEVIHHLRDAGLGQHPDSDPTHEQ